MVPILTNPELNQPNPTLTLNLSYPDLSLTNLTQSLHLPYPYPTSDQPKPHPAPAPVNLAAELEAVGRTGSDEVNALRKQLADLAAAKAITDRECDGLRAQVHCR